MPETAQVASEWDQPTRDKSHGHSQEDLLSFHCSRGVDRTDWGEDPKTRCVYLTEQMQSDLEEELGRACWESSSLLFALDFVLLFIFFFFFYEQAESSYRERKKITILPPSTVFGEDDPAKETGLVLPEVQMLSLFI